MAEVLFYRGLIALLVLVALVVLYRIIHPWIKAGCDRLEITGKKVVAAVVEAEKGRQDESQDMERRLAGRLGRMPPVTNKGGKGGEEGPDGLHEVSALAAEIRSRARPRRGRNTGSSKGLW